MHDVPIEPLVPLDVERIRQIRVERGWSMAEAARRAGFSRQRWHQVESGARPDPTFSTVDRMARALGVTILDLMSDDDTPPPPPTDDDRLRLEVENLARRAAEE